MFGSAVAGFHMFVFSALVIIVKTSSVVFPSAATPVSLSQQVIVSGLAA